VIRELGLTVSHSRRIITANGVVDRRVFGGATVEILGREEQMSVLENDETTPALVGYLVLEAMDFVVDPTKQRLLPNPEHGGEWISDQF
jgi:predicted aspartyl protease